MNIQLSPLEARVIGSLIEKAMTTPDQYPLSLNALTNACNQKSNRDPILNLDERSVQDTLDSLQRKHLVIQKSGFGSRVPKYQHRFCNTGFGSLEFTAQQTAILCELLLRGPQTPGELRSRTARLAEIRGISDIEDALSQLAGRDDGPFVVRLAREPGRRDSRYAHLFGGPIEDAVIDGTAGEPPAIAGETAQSRERSGVPPVGDPSVGEPGQITALLARINALEDRVERLQAALQQLDPPDRRTADQRAD